jgi:hypothetical protein
MESVLAGPAPPFHEYRDKRPTKNVQSLLGFLDSHGDPIFWG